MKNRVKLKGHLGTYMRWPLFLSILLAVTLAVILKISYRSALVMAACLCIYLAVSVTLYLYTKPYITEELIQFAADYSQMHRLVLQELEIPYAVLDENGRILWADLKMKEVFGDEIEKQNISDVLPEINPEEFPDADKGRAHIRSGEHYYIAEITRIHTEDFADSNELLKFRDGDLHLRRLYLYDETETMQARKEIQEQKLVCGIVFVDNYEEALNSTLEERRSLLSAVVDSSITKYLQGYDAIVSKPEKDRYLFVTRQKNLQAMRSSKFSLLDEVRGLNVGNAMNVTLCMGIGVNAASYAQAQEWARHALELALGRGGDQAVVKDGDKMSYYGGRSKQVEKTTRVRARVKAHALKQVIQGKNQVVIMGHQIGDVDCLGAALGVYRAARYLDKPAYIVINTVTRSVKPIMDGFLESPEYDRGMFITSEKAKSIVNMDTALVVVDVNTAERTEGPELFAQTKTVVVIDHHRQSGNSIENPVLSYIEPYASSACEMVTEILQYIGDNIKLMPREADALYAGIIIDTNNFLNETSSRTFEAAAFLRRNGADVTRVRKQLRDDMSYFKAKAEAVKNAVTEGSYAFAICPSQGLDSPMVTGAQVANELLNIKGVEAAFVCTQVADTVYVSARSLETMNVQLVMERFGGGGHTTVAGAQIKDKPAAAVLAEVKDAVKAMKSEGDL